MRPPHGTHLGKNDGRHVPGAAADQLQRGRRAELGHLFEGVREALVQPAAAAAVPALLLPAEAVRGLSLPAQLAELARADVPTRTTSMATGMALSACVCAAQQW